MSIIVVVIIAALALITFGVIKVLKEYQITKRQQKEILNYCRGISNVVITYLKKPETTTDLKTTGGEKGTPPLVKGSPEAKEKMRKAREARNVKRVNRPQKEVKTNEVDS